MGTTLQKNLRSHLKEKSLSVHTLEKRSGVKPGAIQNILQGKSKKPSADLILAVAQQLGSSVEALLQNHAPAPAKANKKKWIPHLYMDALSVMNTIVEEKKLELTKETLLSLVEETYLYSLEGNLEKVDRKFSEWLVSHHCKQ